MSIYLNITDGWMSHRDRVSIRAFVELELNGTNVEEILATILKMLEKDLTEIAPSVKNIVSSITIILETPRKISKSASPEETESWMRLALSEWAREKLTKENVLPNEHKGKEEAIIIFLDRLDADLADAIKNAPVPDMKNDVISMANNSAIAGLLLGTVLLVIISVTAPESLALMAVAIACEFLFPIAGYLLGSWYDAVYDDQKYQASEGNESPVTATSFKKAQQENNTAHKKKVDTENSVTPDEQADKDARAKAQYAYNSPVKKAKVRKAKKDAGDSDAYENDSDTPTPFLAPIPIFSGPALTAEQEMLTAGNTFTTPSYTPACAY